MADDQDRMDVDGMFVYFEFIYVTWIFFDTNFSNFFQKLNWKNQQQNQQQNQHQNHHQNQDLKWKNGQQ